MHECLDSTKSLTPGLYRVPTEETLFQVVNDVGTDDPNEQVTVLFDHPVFLIKIPALAAKSMEVY